MAVASASPRKTGAFWAVGLLATVVAGIALPPLGVICGLVVAALAQREGRWDIRTAALVLAVIFLVLALVVGVVLFDTGGGTSGGTTPG